MRICFKTNGTTTCFTIPVIKIPVFHVKPGDPVERGAVGMAIHDATVLQAIHAVADELSDAHAKKALSDSIASAVKGLQDRSGGTFELHA